MEDRSGRSARILRGPESALNRAVYKSLGYPDGDTITIDIETRAIRLEVPDEVLAKRLAEWCPKAPKVTRGYLALYAKLAGSAAQGATLKMI